MKRLLPALLAVLAASACAHAPGPLGTVPGVGAGVVPAAAPAPEAPAPAQEVPSDRPITFAAVGDVMLGSTFPDETGGMLPPEDGVLLLADLTPALSDADVTFGNLEGPLLDGGTSEKCAGSKSGRCFAFRVPTRYARLLRDAGFDVVSVANNHVGDFGDEGRASTRAALASVGIRWSGAPGEVARLDVRGTRIALVAFSVSAGTNDLRDIPAAAKLVSDLAAGSDLVVVSFHGGAEGAAFQHVAPGSEAFYGEDRGDLRAFAHAVVDAGADLVIGHGPHVVRGMEVYRGRLVAYSLGNFATYGGMNLSGPNGLTLVLQARIARDGTFLGGRIVPARQERPGGPWLDESGAILGVVRGLSQQDFGPTAVVVGDDGSLAPPPAPPAAAPAAPGV